MNSMPRNRILIVATDLMLQSRVREGAQVLGYEPVLADADALDDAGDALVFVDLHVEGIDWRDAVARAKAAGAPVLAFGRHTEADLLQQARDAGCDRVVARSTLVTELPRLIEALAGRGPHREEA